MLPKDESPGHRKRLREKFLKSGLKGFHDYEIIELLLSLGVPRKDCKPQAKEVIKRFKTLRGALEASPEELQQIAGSSQGVPQGKNHRKARIHLRQGLF